MESSCKMKSNEIEMPNNYRQLKLGKSNLKKEKKESK